MNCPKCGNQVPEGSAFCNKCGEALSNEIQCPSCGNITTTDSVFCPKCGQRLHSNENQGETYNQQQERLRQQKQAEQAAAAAAAAQQRQEMQRQQQEAERQRQLQQEQMRQQQASQPWSTPQSDDNDDDYEPKSNFNRNLLMGIGIVVGIVVLLMLLRTCGGDSDRPANDAAADSIAAATAGINGQDPLVIFNSEMSRSNYGGDGAHTAAAIAVPAHNGKPNYILGITSMSDPSKRSFYKIYKLTEQGNTWNLEQLHTQYINGRAVSFDNAELIASNAQTPRAVTINGRDYFYYAYVNMPQGAHVGGTGRVSLSLFDIDEHSLTTLDYDGIINVEEDGRQHINGKPLQSVSTDLTRFLAQEAQSIKIIHFPTPQELAEQAEAERAKEEELAKQQEEANQPNGEVDPNANWEKDNAETVKAAQAGEEVAVKKQTYDKPIFRIEDKHKSINNKDYTVFSDKSGGVYGFNKSTGKYFVIYKPAAPTTPTDIGFEDSENNILNIRTANGRLEYNLKTDKVKAKE